MTSPAGIRTFVYPDDFVAVYELWAKAGPGLHLGRSDSQDEIAKKLKRDPDLFLVAEVDGRIVGAVVGGFDGRRGLVYHLGVDAAYRKNGIGRQLMDALEGRLRAKGCLRSYLLVTHDNLEAQRFYERHDWEPMDLLVYAKDLD